MYTFVWFSGAIWETPSKKTAVILSHRYVIGVKIVLRDISTKFCDIISNGIKVIERTQFLYWKIQRGIIPPKMQVE